MEDKPIFIIIGALTVLIGLVPLLGIMDTMGEVTTKSNDNQQLEKLAGGVNDECSGRSGFIRLDLQSGAIDVADNGNSLELTIAGETNKTRLEDCKAEFVNDIEGGIDAGETTVNFSKDDDEDNLVLVGTN